MSLLVTACAHAPAANPKPLGLTCGVSRVSSVRPADSVYARFRDALASMHVATHTDSVARSLLVSGADAPHGRGSALMRQARIYLDFHVIAAPGDSAGSTYSVAPGLSVEPPGISVDDAWDLYRQADQLAADVMGRAGLYWGRCFGVKPGTE